MATMKMEAFQEADKIPKGIRSTQNLFGITEVAENGIFRFRNRQYGRCYRLEEANYNMEDESGKGEMFLKYCGFLNRQQAPFKVTIVNRYSDSKATLEKNRYVETGDAWDAVRTAYNDIFTREDGILDNLVQERYFTSSSSLRDRKAVTQHFRMQDDSMRKFLNEYNSGCEVLNDTAWLRLLQNITKPGKENEFQYTPGKRADFKNEICPVYLRENENEMETEDGFIRVMFLKSFPGSIPDDILYRLSALSVPSLVTLDSHPVPKHIGEKMMADKLYTVENTIRKQQQIRNKNQDYSSDISRPVKKQKEMVENTLKEMEKNDAFLFYNSVYIVFFAKTPEKLEEVTEQVRENAEECDAVADILYLQQKEGFVTALPCIGREVQASCSMLTQPTAAFYPFSAMDVQVPDGVFYGFNQLTGRAIRGNRALDREFMDNGHCIVFGPTGSGKSVIVKSEAVQHRIQLPEGRMFFLDPTGEYDDIVTLSGGEVIRFTTNSDVTLNPFYINRTGKSAKEIDELILSKESLAIALLELAANGEALSGIYRGIIDEATRKAFREKEGEVLPEDIAAQIATDTEIGKEVATLWDIYVHGQLRFFNQTSNLNTSASVISYNLAGLLQETKRAVMLVLLDTLEEQIRLNFNQNLVSFVYIDEMDKIMELESTQTRLTSAWKMYRKLNCNICGILQNISKLPKNPIVEDMLDNTAVRILLKQKGKDLAVAKDLLHLTDAQAAYLKSAEKGCGLMQYGSATVAFTNSFDAEKDKLLYDLYNTNPVECAQRIGQSAEKEEDSIFYRMTHEVFDMEQKNELKLALQAGIPDEKILKYFHSAIPAAQMRRYREALLAYQEAGNIIRELEEESLNGTAAG